MAILRTQFSLSPCRFPRGIHNSYMSFELDWLARWHRKSGTNTHCQGKTGKSREHELTSPLSIKRRREGLSWSRLSKSFYVTALWTISIYLLTSSTQYCGGSWPEWRPEEHLDEPSDECFLAQKTSFCSTYLMIGSMTFGYNADAAFKNTTVDIIDHSKGLLSSSVWRGRERRCPLPISYQILETPRHIQCWGAAQTDNGGQSNGSHNLSPRFTDRDGISQKIYIGCLLSATDTGLIKEWRFILCSLGGSRKTQACIKFAQDYEVK